LTEATSFVLPVDKPEGPTSHDVVASARRAFGVRRIGHTGTLDPFASGLLLLCVGAATRIAEYLTNLPKTYRAVARLDGRTLTDDNTSERIEQSDHWRRLNADQVKDALQTQAGDIMQLPPQYSAKRIAGERAYNIARRGDVATVVPAQVTIYAITLVRAELPEVEFEVKCSSGTYIRSIARDVGALLGTGGYLTRLRRTQIGKHDIQSAVPQDQLVDDAKVRAAALTPVQALSHLPSMELNEEQERAIRFGQSLETAVPSNGAIMLVRNNVLVAIAAVEGTRLRPRKVFSDS
jgi:tRNA pseudouridine55 synthase